MKKRFTFFAGILAGVVLCAMLVSALWYTPAEAQGGVSNLDHIIASGNVTAVGDVAAGDDVTVADDLTVTDDSSFTGWVRTVPVSALTVTQNGTITPTGSLQLLTAAGAVGTNSIAVGTAGYHLIVLNTGTNSITISDTAVIVLGSATRALGQYDNLSLVSDGTRWIEVSFVNN